MIVGKTCVGSIDGSCANFIINNEIGYTYASGDSEALANLIKELDFNKLSEIGKHSKEVYYKKYRKELFINRLIEELNKLANHNS